MLVNGNRPVIKRLQILWWKMEWNKCIMQLSMRMIFNSCFRFQIRSESGRSRVQSPAAPSLFHWMVVKCRQGPGFNSLATDTFVLNWKTLPFPPSRNGLPFNATTPGNKFHSTYFQSIKFQGTHTHVLNCASTSLIYFVGSNALQLKLWEGLGSST